MGTESSTFKKILTVSLLGPSSGLKECPTVKFEDPRHAVLVGRLMALTEQLQRLTLTESVDPADVVKCFKERVRLGQEFRRVFGFSWPL